MQGRPKQNQRCSTHKAERGNAILEFALTTTIFLSLLMAAGDFALTIYARALLHNAVREGSRFATTAQTIDGLGHDDSIREFIRQRSIGLLSQSDLSKISIQYYGPDGIFPVSENAAGNLVKISLRNHQITPVAAFMRSHYPISLATTAVDVMEPFDGAPPAR
jgi:hypothetical protein